MASLTDTSIKRPVATSMAYLVIITVGIVGFLFLPVDLLPPVEFTRLTVFTSYPNVGPEEMEQIVTDPVENALSGIPNLDRISSRSSEGSSMVTLEFARGTNIDEASNDVRSALDRIRRSLPPEVDQPVIWKFDPNNFAIVTIAVESRRPMEEVTRLLERDLSNRFEQIPGVGTVELRGGVNRQIHVDLERDRLLAAGLTPADVQAALARENQTLPGGNVKEGLRDLYVRSQGEYTSVAQIAETVIRYVDDRPIRVRDVARVEDGYEDVRFLSELDGVPIIRVQIQKQSGANTVTVADAIVAEVGRINAEHSDLRMKVISDQSTFIRQSIDNVRSSAVWGGLLAILVLYLFLRNGSSTSIIAIAIPISVVATFGVLYYGGMTLNQMTFGGLALGIGMMVDNGIVVLENIVRHREEHRMSILESARVGTREVVGAIIASTLTTIVIFLPIGFMQTTIGDLFTALALVVVFSLVCSLMVALTLIPVLASRFLNVKLPEEGKPIHASGFQKWFDGLEQKYSASLRTVVRHRKLVAGVSFTLVAAAFAAFPLIPVELAPQTDADEIQVTMEMSQGTNVAVVQAYLQELEQAVRPLLPMDQVREVATETRFGNAQVTVRLKDPSERTIESQALADGLRRKLVSAVPGAEIRVEAQSGLWVLRRLFSTGTGNEAVQIELRGYDLDVADITAREIMGRVERIPGVTGVRLSRREGRPEQNLEFDREKIASLGLSVQQVGRAIQTSVGGSRAGQFREGGDEYPIIVRLRPEDRLTVQDLDDIAVRTPAGETIPVASLVLPVRGRAPTTIERKDGVRVNYVYATLEKGVALGDAVEAIRSDLSRMNLPDGFSIAFSGEYEEQQKAQTDFLIAVLLALALIYMVMAGQFERYLDPLIVMFAVPVAIIGVVPTMLLTGTTFNMQSIMGMVMLIGIVVNNAIVLVDYVNLLRREQGMALLDSVVEAGRLRLRPIAMTTLTTVLGLLPLALGIGAGAEIQASLARVVIGGLTASTLVTLVLIPVVYVSAHGALDRLRAWSEARRGPAPSMVAVPSEPS